MFKYLYDSSDLGTSLSTCALHPVMHIPAGLSYIIQNQTSQDNIDLIMSRSLN